MQTLRWWVAMAGCILTALVHEAAAAKPPAVLFTSGLHQAYFTKPLHAEGIELHTCSPAQLPELLPTGDYDAAVVTGGLAVRGFSTPVRSAWLPPPAKRLPSATRRPYRPWTCRQPSNCRRTWPSSSARPRVSLLKGRASGSTAASS